MKFEKFVKSIGVDGVVYERQNGELWLASYSVFMRIPQNVRSVTGRDKFNMPEGMENIINCAALGIPCELSKAIMPHPDSGIKDCIRVFATENNLCEIPVANADYGLIQKTDVLEIHSKYDSETGKDVAKALLVKHSPQISSDEPELVGIILPIGAEAE